MLVEQIAIIIGLALLGYRIFLKLNLLNPALMGPMVFVGLYQIFMGGLPELSSPLINMFQIIIGLSVGSKINHKNIKGIQKIWIPSVIIALYTLASTAIMSVLIRNFTADYSTALFSAAPGGITEMTVIALSYDSDIAIISTFQFVRLLVILSTIPFIAKKVGKNKRVETEESKDKPTDTVQSFTAKKLILYGLGILGGIILVGLRFPGGGVIGAFTALGLANIVSHQSYAFPRKLMKFALFGVGVTIGLEFSHQMLSQMNQMFLPIIGFTLIIVLGNLFIGWFIRHITHWDMITCILSSAPGGLSQMVIVGEEMKADTVKISILQLVRVITIITCIPIVAAILFG